MQWLLLLTAGGFEVFWALGLKYSHGFTRLVPSVLTALGMIASFYFLSLALKNLPLGTAYAIWTGIGTIGTAIFGIILFKEPMDAARLVCIALIITGIAGLKFLSSN
jgi:quaternary ammonium compound-resistance protein SugE